MGALTAGSVILIPFPFSDLSSTKLRPAVVLTTLDKGDCIFPPVKPQHTKLNNMKGDSDA
jgi:hypothetical protein